MISIQNASFIPDKLRSMKYTVFKKTYIMTLRKWYNLNVVLQRKSLVKYKLQRNEQPNTIYYKLEQMNILKFSVI